MTRMKDRLVARLTPRRRRWLGGGGLAVVVLAIAACSPPLDPSFGGGDGVVTIAGSPTSWDQPSAVAVQPDGKIVLLFDGGLMRFNPDGGLDASFGTGGRVVPLGGISASCSDLELQPDGKLLVSSRVPIDTNPGEVGGIRRFNPDGTLDTTFGSGGMTYLNTDDSPCDLQLQQDGKIVASISSRSPGLKVARWLPDGSLDVGFGANGLAEIWLSHPQYRQWTSSVAVQPDGKIVAAGGAGRYDELPPPAASLARFNSDGSVDTTFAGQGGLVSELGGWATDVAVRPNGRILITGTTHPRYSADGTPRFFLAQFNAAGAPDNSFGTRGVVRTVDDGDASAMTLLDDGKVVVVGREWLPDYEPDGHDGFITVRYNVNGTLDQSHGAAGVGTTDHFEGDGEHAYELAVQPDGKLIVVGTIPSQAEESGTDAGIYRYDTN